MSGNRSLAGPVQSRPQREPGKVTKQLNARVPRNRISGQIGTIIVISPLGSQCDAEFVTRAHFRLEPPHQLGIVNSQPLRIHLGAAMTAGQVHVECQKRRLAWHYLIDDDRGRQSVVLIHPGCLNPDLGHVLQVEDRILGMQPPESGGLLKRRNGD